MTWFRCGMKKSVDDTVLNSLIDRSIVSIVSDVVNIGGSAFSSCINLISAVFPNVTSVSSTAFRGCTALTTVDMPKATELFTGAFYGCTSLTSVTFPKLHNIYATVFQNCTSLNSVTLENSTMCQLAGTNAFDNTQFASSRSGGTVYVPSDLVTTYQNDATWAALLALNANNKIQAIT